jgi:hypothetical protein
LLVQKKKTVRKKIDDGACKGAEKLIELKREVIKVTDSEFRVQCSDGSRTYGVNMAIECCKCIVGKDGTLCKHQMMVSKLFKIPSRLNLPQLTSSTAQDLLLLVHGKIDIPAGFCPTPVGVQRIKTDASTVRQVPEKDSNFTSRSHTVELEAAIGPQSTEKDWKILLASLQRRSEEVCGEEFKSAFLLFLGKSMVKKIPSDEPNLQLSQLCHEGANRRDKLYRYSVKRSILVITRYFLYGTPFWPKK